MHISTKAGVAFHDAFVKAFGSLIVTAGFQIHLLIKTFSQIFLSMSVIH